PLCTDSANAAAHHHRRQPIYERSDRFTRNSIELPAIPAFTQPFVSGDANEAEWTPYVPIRRRTCAAVGSTASGYLLSGSGFLQRCSRVFCFRQFPGRFQRTQRPGSKRFWGGVVPSQSISSILFFPGHVAAHPFAEPHTGSALREF